MINSFELLHIGPTSSPEVQAHNFDLACCPGRASDSRQLKKVGNFQLSQLGQITLPSTPAHDLLDRLQPRTIVLADKAYDTNSIRDLIAAQGAVPNIPAKSNRKWKPCYSKTLYRKRNQVERFFSKLKHFRRIATRYDKLAENFPAMVKLASIRLRLRAYEPTV